MSWQNGNFQHESAISFVYAVVKYLDTLFKEARYDITAVSALRYCDVRFRVREAKLCQKLNVYIWDDLNMLCKLSCIHRDHVQPHDFLLFLYSEMGSDTLGVQQWTNSSLAKKARSTCAWIRNALTHFPRKVQVILPPPLVMIETTTSNEKVTSITASIPEHQHPVVTDHAVPPIVRTTHTPPITISETVRPRASYPPVPISILDQPVSDIPIVHIPLLKTPESNTTTTTQLECTPLADRVEPLMSELVDHSPIPTPPGPELSEHPSIALDASFADGPTMI